MTRRRVRSPPAPNNTMAQGSAGASVGRVSSALAASISGAFADIGYSLGWDIGGRLLRCDLFGGALQASFGSRWTPSLLSWRSCSRGQDGISWVRQEGEPIRHSRA